MTRSRAATTILFAGMITSPVWVCLLMLAAGFWIGTIGAVIGVATCVVWIWGVLTGHFTSERMT